MPYLGLVCCAHPVQDTPGLHHLLERGVRVTGTPGFFEREKAEVAFSALLALLRNLRGEPEWANAAPPGARPFFDLRVGLLGTGPVVETTASILTAFGAEAASANVVTTKAGASTWDALPAGWADALVTFDTGEDMLPLDTEAGPLHWLKTGGLLVDAGWEPTRGHMHVLRHLASGRIGAASLPELSACAEWFPRDWAGKAPGLMLWRGGWPYPCGRDAITVQNVEAFVAGRPLRIRSEGLNEASARSQGPRLLRCRGWGGVGLYLLCGGYPVRAAPRQRVA